MTGLRVLYIDDEPEAYEVFWNLINHSWKKLYPEITLIHNRNEDYVSNYHIAIKKLEDFPDVYQVLIVDLLFPQNIGSSDENSAQVDGGIEVIREVREGKATSSEKLVIVVISVGHSKDFPNLKDNAVSVGADIFKYRSEFKKDQYPKAKQLCTEIYEKLLTRRIIADPINFVFENNPKMNFVISEIGEETIKSLYKKVLNQQFLPQKVEINYLTPGLSGAFVLRAKSSEKEKPAANHLFKISRDKKMLIKEIRNCPPLGIYSSGLIINYLLNKNDLGAKGGGLPQEEEWFAIGAVFKKGAYTLLDWLKLTERLSLLLNLKPIEDSHLWQRQVFFDEFSC